MKPDHTFPASLILRPCVYGWRRNENYLYIGQSIRVIARLRNHHVVDKGVKIQGLDVIDIWYCDKSELGNFERALIKHFNPPLNIVTYEKDRRVIKKAEFATFKDAARVAEILVVYPNSRKGKGPTPITQAELDSIKKRNPDFNVEEYLARHFSGNGT